MGTTCFFNNGPRKPAPEPINNNPSSEEKKPKKKKKEKNPTKDIERTNTNKKDTSEVNSDKNITQTTINRKKRKNELNKESEKQEIKKKIKILKKSNLLISYNPELKIENNFYIVCPSCKLLFPSIKKYEYDSDKKDFMISYSCKCNSSDKLSKSLFINFINRNKPFEKNEQFNESKIARKLKEEIEHKEDFQGKEILSSALKNSISINNAAPPASVNKSIKESNLIKSFYPNFKANPLCAIKEEEEEKEAKNKQKKEVIFSQAIWQMGEEQENKEKSEYKEYTCVKTFQKNARIASLIELQSGFLASGSYDCTICIWDINQPEGSLYVKEFQEDGIVICLMEFKPNILLAGTNNNYISVWDLNSKNKDSISIFIGHERWVNALVKCNEEVFASCSNDKCIITWDYYKKKQIRKINAHNDCILALIKLSDGSLCSGGADLITKIWNWKTGECLFTLEGYNNWIRCICQFDEQTLLVGSENIITIWKNNKEIIAFLSEHQHDVRNICAINKKYFASASFDNTIKIWDINELDCVQTLKGHTSNVTNVIKLKGRDVLASCSTDYTIKIWKPN